MVVNSLSTPRNEPVIKELPGDDNSDGDFIDPDNPKIITTAIERKFLRVVQELLPNEPLYAKDTESYYSILYQNKNNRWLARFSGDKKRPSVQFIIRLTEQHINEIKRAGLEIGPGDQVIIDKPENLLRISGLLFDSLTYCQNDENFKVKKS